MSHAHRRHVHHKRAPQPQPQVFKTVFYTAPPTFKGKIAGYSTVLGGGGGGNKNAPTRKTTAATPTKVTKATPKVTSSKTTLKSVPTSTKKKTTTIVDEEDEEDEDSKDEEEEEDRSFTSSTIKLKESSTTSEDAFAATKDASLSGTTTSAVPTVEAKSGGMSGGATAGVVAGIIAIILVGLAFVAFLYRKKQQKRMQEAYGKPEDEKKAAPVRQVTNFDEKDPSPFADQLPQHQEPPHSATSFGSSVTAPRVSYRPGSEFAPNFAAGAAAGAALSTANGRLNPAAAPVNKHQQQEIVRKPAPQPLALAQSNFESQQPQQPQQPQQQQPQPSYVAFVPGAQNSPSSSTFSGEAPGTPVAGAAAGQPLMLVFRVTLDFKPSMADELELRTGDLVRLMHEYDDGWALCSKMDRSQQGVCPRTCLSQKPVKPRPKNAPGAPGPRGPPRHNGPPGRPQTPQSRPQTPQGMQSRPQTPNGQRGNATPQHSPPRVHIIPEITVSPVDDSPPVSLSKPYPNERQGSPLANN
jgi:cbb3-type cytochrome oxidase subunit 3